MGRWSCWACVVAVVAGCSPATQEPRVVAPAWIDVSPHTVGFVTAKGARLQYLDWGGTGPTLILIHGLGDNPHVFDDLVPALGGGFRVVAYARRGHGRSSMDGPFDAATLVGDLVAVMDGLGIATAHLAGWSMGGNEITAMAGSHPERVGRIVYLDSGYDWGDPALIAAVREFPVDPVPPLEARASLDAFRRWHHRTWVPAVTDGSRLEAYIRDLVDVNADGSVTPLPNDTVSAALSQALYATRRDYAKVNAPALAIYAGTFFDVAHGDAAQRAKNRDWEEKHMKPFRTASVERIRRELRSVEVLSVPGTHMDFPFTSRSQVASAITRFLVQGQQ